MLPQGRFQAFLRASSAERHAVLQRLFRTRRFEEVERWLVERRVELRRRLPDPPRPVRGRASTASRRPPGSALPDDWDLHDLDAGGRRRLARALGRGRADRSRRRAAPIGAARLDGRHRGRRARPGGARRGRAPGRCARPRRGAPSDARRRSTASQDAEATLARARSTRTAGPPRCSRWRCASRPPRPSTPRPTDRAAAPPRRGLRAARRAGRRRRRSTSLGRPPPGSTRSAPSPSPGSPASGSSSDERTGVTP